jgi:hypothetical protein
MRRAYNGDIGAIADYIKDRLLLARIPVYDAKEKWGTVRVSCTFGWYSLHDVVYPGYHFNQFPRWLQVLDYKVLSTFVQYASKLAEPYHRKVYRRAYENAVRKYPHHRTAILEWADWPELLKGL